MKTILLITSGLVIVYFLSVFTSTAHAKNEKFYQNKHCTGKLEVRLKDRTRIDCETTHFAIEYDFASKWAEAIGQSLHYARMTGKLPGIVLIVEDAAKDCKYVRRLLSNVDHYMIPILVQTVGQQCKNITSPNYSVKS